MAVTKDYRDLTKPLQKTVENRAEEIAHREPTVLSVPILTDETKLATNEADEFGTAYREIAAKSDESLAELKRKLAAPVSRVVYRDLEATIWTLWRVQPADVTVNHIGQALDLLARTSAGGVELDQLSCDVCGVDYARLMLLIRPSLLGAADMSTGPRVPRKSAATTAESVASEVAQLPGGRSDPEPGHEDGAASAPRRRRGRPFKIDVAKKQAALAERERGKSWREVAKLLYSVVYPTRQQIRNAPSVLKHYKEKTLIRPPVPLP